MNRELYDKIVCAMTHSLSDCDECMKCGLHGVDVRMNLISELAKETGNPLPWEEENER